MAGVSDTNPGPSGAGYVGAGPCGRTGFATPSAPFEELVDEEGSHKSLVFDHASEAHIEYQRPNRCGRDEYPVRLGEKRFTEKANTPIEPVDNSRFRLIDRKEAKIGSQPTMAFALSSR